MHSHFSPTDPVTLFGALFVAAVLTQWWLARRSAPSAGIEPSHIDLLLPLALVGGIAGGILLAMLPPRDVTLAGAAAGVDIRLRLFGIVVSGALVLFVYSRITHLRFRTLLDVFAVPTLVAIGVHRVGCFFAGCCWGDLAIIDGGILDLAGTDVARQMQTLPWLAGDWVRWAVSYGPGTWPYEQQLAVGLIGPDAAQSMPVHPVQLYEVAMLAVAIFALRQVSPAGNRPGLLAAAATVAYAAGRFLLEYLRADGALLAGNLTLVQLECLLLIAAAVIAAYLTTRDPTSRAVPA